ncbi:MAG: UDP-N-acetylmuramate dehydrogenase [Selenomonadaceae bacterium]|nr:UDP-N-acetylmuramate dehydrogenase [Selenomonadaceae bacterium]
MKNQAFEEACRAFLPEGQLLVDEPMKKHTTFQIGGPADYLVMPSSIEDVQRIVRAASAAHLPFMVLGNGSNVLVSDRGIRGVVLKLDKPMANIRVVGTQVIAMAGALLKDVSAAAAAHGLTGLEYACGIPGSAGGAVFMNAGAYAGETKQVAKAVRAVTREGEIQTFSEDALDLGYRHSAFQTNGAIICEVTFQCEPGDQGEIDGKIQDYTERRESKQPLEMPSAGSTFKRPKGYFAGTLIDQTGLKGLSVGGAQVSTKHAGFVVNKGGATAADVLHLIAEVQRRVQSAHGVLLHPEVRLIGDWDPALLASVQ